MTEPTHNKGHTLDLVISKVLNISKVVMTDIVLSDYSCVFFESSISVHTNFETEIIAKQHITDNTSETFIQAFSSIPTLSWVSVNELVDNFNYKITNVIDAIAPTKVKVVSCKKRFQWRNAMLLRI